MIYTKLTKLAMNIAYEAHKDQKDKSGVPYIFHPFHLADQLNDEEACATALLHDVVEDCEEYNFERLAREGIPEKVIDALKLLTHEKSVPYMDYIKALGNNVISRQVKILDLKHNMDESRLDDIVSEEIRERLAKKHKIYQEALSYLENCGC